MTYKPGDVLTAKDVGRYMEAARAVELNEARPDFNPLYDRYNIDVKAEIDGSNFKPFSVCKATAPLDGGDYLQVRGLGTVLLYQQHRYQLVVLDGRAITPTSYKNGKAAYTHQPVHIGIENSALNGDNTVKYHDRPHGVSNNGWLVPDKGGFRIIDYKATVWADGTKTVLAFQQEIVQNYCSNRFSHNVDTNHPGDIIPCLYNNNGTYTFGKGWSLIPVYLTNSVDPEFLTAGFFHVFGTILFRKVASIKTFDRASVFFRLWVMDENGPVHPVVGADHSFDLWCTPTRFHPTTGAPSESSLDSQLTRVISVPVFIDLKQFLGYQVWGYWADTPATPLEPGVAAMACDLYCQQIQHNSHYYDGIS